MKSKTRFLSSSAIKIIKKKQTVYVPDLTCSSCKVTSLRFCSTVLPAVVFIQILDELCVIIMHTNHDKLKHRTHVTIQHVSFNSITVIITSNHVWLYQLKSFHLLSFYLRYIYLLKHNNDVRFCWASKGHNNIKIHSLIKMILTFNSFSSFTSSCLNYFCLFTLKFLSLRQLLELQIIFTNEIVCTIF